MSIVITVASVLPPGPGKKQASVIDSTGKRWGIKPADMSNYQQFGNYDIIRFSENVFQGKTYYTIEQAVPVGGNPNVSPSPSNYNQKPNYPGPSLQQASSYDDDQRRMDIFVSVMINNSSFDPACTPEDELVDICNMFKRVWTRVYGPKPDPISSTRARGGSDKELDDRIPFGPERR